MKGVEGLTPARIKQIVSAMLENPEGRPGIGTLDNFEDMFIWVCFDCGAYGANKRRYFAAKEAFEHNWIWCEKEKAAS